MLAHRMLLRIRLPPPYMGFNLGSTKYRQTSAGKIEPYVFESPLIRLMKDHLYQDAFHDGQILPQGPCQS